MHTHLNKIQNYFRLTSVFLIWGLTYLPHPALAQDGRDFYEAKIIINLTTDKSTTFIRAPGQKEFTEETGGGGSAMPANSFIKMDLRIIVDKNESNRVLKMVDQGFTSEPSGCTPSEYGPLDMEEDLRYFFNASATSEQNFEYRISLYPGDRSNHWANDVYCEYDSDYGDKRAILRFNGYYFIKHRNLKNGLDVVFHGVTLTDSEIDKM